MMQLILYQLYTHKQKPRVQGLTRRKHSSFRLKRVADTNSYITISQAESYKYNTDQSSCKNTLAQTVGKLHVFCFLYKNALVQKKTFIFSYFPVLSVPSRIFYIDKNSFSAKQLTLTQGMPTKGTSLVQYNSFDSHIQKDTFKLIKESFPFSQKFLF